MVGPEEMLQVVQGIMVECQAPTPEATAANFNKRLAEAGFAPEGVAMMGQSLGVAWNMQPDMRPEEGISGAMTLGILIGYRKGTGELK